MDAGSLRARHPNVLRVIGNSRPNQDLRFDKHGAGIPSRRYVRRLGPRLLPERHAVCNNMPCEAARDTEIEPVIALRERGSGV